MEDVENINDFEPLFSEDTPEVEKPVAAVQVGASHPVLGTITLGLRLDIVTSPDLSASVGTCFPDKFPVGFS